MNNYPSVTALAVKSMALFRWLYRAIGTLLAPPFCSECGTFFLEHHIFCSSCFATIKPVASLTISLTARKKMVVYAVGQYEQPLKRLVLAKFNNNAIPARQLGDLIVSAPFFNADMFDCIIPIPLHWTRLSSRGFNQAQEMAYRISAHCGKPVINALKRVKKTQFQSSLRRVARSNNMHDAFMLSEKHVSQLYGKKILLVDDLLTTGATLYAAGRVILSANPVLIQGVVACRAW